MTDLRLCPFGCAFMLVMLVWSADTPAPITERIVESDLGSCPLSQLYAGEHFRHDGHLYLRCVPEPNGRWIGLPEDAHMHLLYAAAGDEILCARVSDTAGGRFSNGVRGGLLLLPAGTLVQRVAVELAVTRTE